MNKLIEDSLNVVIALEGIVLQEHCDKAKEALKQLQSESRMYSEDEVKGFPEWMSGLLISNYKSGGTWFYNNKFYTTNQLLKLYLQSLQPKTEPTK